MGTDMHVAAFKRSGEKWERLERKVNGERQELPSDRSYVLFAALAGVRNGAGFAGVKLFEPLKPLAEGRGLPDWLTVKGDAHEGTWLGYHDFTHFTLEEFWNYDWDQTLQQCGYVDAAEWATMGCRPGRPRSYCGGTNGEVVSQEELTRRVKQEFKAWPRAYTFVEWEGCLRWEVENNPFYLAAEALSAIYEPKDVLLVVGFDS